MWDRRQASSRQPAPAPFLAGGVVKDSHAFPAPIGAAASCSSRMDEIRSPELRTVAQRALEQWTDGEEDPEGERVFLDAAVGILAAVEGQVDPASLRTDEPASLVLKRRTVDRIRSELLRLSEEPCGEREEPHRTGRLLEYMRHLEGVRSALEPDGLRDFELSLMGPDGLELTTEVCHDLRSPLSSVLFLAETLRGGQSGDLSDVQRRQVGLIYSASLSMLSIVSDVIELCRGGNELNEREPGPFSVRQVLESVKEMAAPMAEEKGLDFRVQGIEEDARRGHPVALSRVLLNLATNAIKFTDQGAVEVRAQAETDTLVRFEVQDTGSGIDPKMQDHLYQAFRASERRKGIRFSGTGLGLTIARKLVEAMGSELHFETQWDEGTTFYFTLSLPPTPVG